MKRFVQKITLVSLSIGTTWLTPLASAETHALLIGINDYSEVKGKTMETDLRGAVRDIEIASEILKTDLKVPESNIRTLLNADATDAKFQEALLDLLNVVKPGDQVVLWFSGRGTTVPALQKDQPGECSILLQDLVAVPESFLKGVAAHLSGNVIKFTAILDCGFGRTEPTGTQIGSLRNRSLPFEDLKAAGAVKVKRVKLAGLLERKGVATRNPGVHESAPYVLLAAAGPNQDAFEASIAENAPVSGLFTRLLAEALIEQTSASAETIFKSISQGLTRYKGASKPRIEYSNPERAKLPPIVPG